MSSLTSSINFILKHNLRLHKNVTEKEISIEKFPAMLYSPKKCRGTILVIHGMSPGGNEDPRMVNLCRSLAGSGFRVIAPHYKKIAYLKIEKSEIQDIIKSIKFIVQSPLLCPKKRIGLFSVSFTGGLSLIAASDPSVNPYISSILIVGGHGDVKSTVEYFMEKSDLDDYGSMIVLHNFIEYGTGKNPALAKAFYYSAIDNSQNSDRLPGHLKKLPPRDINLFQRLKTDTHSRITMWEKIIAAAAKKNVFMDDISPLPVIDRIDAAVTFIHGKNDPVIPPEQSLMMHEKRIGAGKKSKLLLTPILSHGNVSLGLSRVPALGEFAKAIAYFFKHI